MGLVGSLTAINAPVVEDWRRPRIANLGANGRFMVVGQVRVLSLPYRILGRIVSNNGTVTTSVSVTNSAVDEYHPDIGGDPFASPSFFTIVWEHATSSTNHDIYARQVDANGLLSPGPTVIQGNSLNQTWPSISKSDGGGPRSSQRFVIAWQQSRPTFPFDEDIHGALLTWDGLPVQVGFGTTFGIATSTDNDVFPQPSSPALPSSTGQRAILVAYERTNVNGGDIAATCIDQHGNVLASGNLNVLANDPFLPFSQARPSVDSDGFRFVVAYEQPYPPSATIDIQAMLVACGGNSLLIEEGVILAATSAAESNVQVATPYSGNGIASGSALITNQRAFGTYAIEAWQYFSSSTGRFVTRTSSCGTLGIQHSGFAALGWTTGFSLSASSNVQLCLVGYPMIATPIGACPGCYLGVVNGTLLLGPSYSLAIPNDPLFIGFQYAVQGVELAPVGPCLGQIHLSDTIDVTVY
jgi:hypothetical protein